MSAATLFKVGSSLVGGFLGNSAAKKKAKAMRAMANYNAKIQMQNAQDEADAIGLAGRRLVRSQREQMAQARMNVFARGGDESRAGDLLSLVDMLELMKLDQLNLKREQDVVLARGYNQAEMTKYSGELQAQQQITAGRTALFKGIIGAGEAYFEPKIKVDYNLGKGYSALNTRAQSSRFGMYDGSGGLPA